MKFFLVGGAVRDSLLNLKVNERDWVVEGASPDQLLALGYTQVGKDFPVFLHPQTHEEYALARTERKSGSGHTGFLIHASPEVTLQEDLLRRDLTVNAIAQDEHGTFIDPYQGQQDLENRILRHVSSAFSEDPLRVLRVARFAAKLHDLQFTIATETLELMKSITLSGELNTLPAERIWQETAKALQTNNPHIYFQILRECGALKALMHEIDDLFGVPQPEKHHPEIDTGVHALLSLQQASLLSNDPSVRFAALVHDLGKAKTPADILPRHIGHEKRGLPLIKNLCQRITVPNQFCDLALLVAEFHTHCHRADELRSETIYTVLKACRAFQHPERLELFLLACEADARGRTGLEIKPYPQIKRFKKALSACKSIETTELIAAGFSGVALGKEIQRRQIGAIQKTSPSIHNN